MLEATDLTRLKATNKIKTNTEILFRKRKMRSLTWKFFDRIDSTLASCQTCQVGDIMIPIMNSQHFQGSYS
jgi:hypothetical protein